MVDFAVDLLHFFARFKEVQEFGWSWLTASFLALCAFTTYQWYAYGRQAWHIWSKGSAKSVSPGMFAQMTIFMGVSLTYGLQSQSLALAYTGTTFPVVLCITIGVWKFKSLGWQDWAAVALCALVVGSYLTDVPLAVIFAILMFGGMMPFFLQIYELWKEKTRGDLKPGWLVPVFFKGLLWSIYGFTKPDLAIAIVGPIMVTTIGTILFLWWYYPEADDIAPALNITR